MPSSGARAGPASPDALSVLAGTERAEARHSHHHTDPQVRSGPHLIDAIGEMRTLVRK